MPHPRHFTAADLATMPEDGKRYEVIDGDLFVSPCPGGRHQPIVIRLIDALAQYLKPGRRMDELLAGPADITFAEDSLVEPDVLVADTAAFLRTGDWRDVTTMHLVVEIISPSTARTDRTRKLSLYQRYGVPTYWIVDPIARQIESWTPLATSAVVHRDTIEWRHPALADSLTIDLGKLFTFDAPESPQGER
ncbi:MAG TPA: Uma2 family endonuclease [Gemmatimonadales bacterium]